LYADVSVEFKWAHTLLADTKGLKGQERNATEQMVHRKGFEDVERHFATTIKSKTLRPSPWL
jgi:hypothetical protein